MNIAFIPIQLVIDENPIREIRKVKSFGFVLFEDGEQEKINNTIFKMISGQEIEISERIEGFYSINKLFEKIEALSKEISDKDNIILENELFDH